MERATDIREPLKCSLAAEVLRSFGELRLRVHGSSMVPSICPGDILTVRRQDIGEVLRGDVVLFAREGRLYAHRVVEKIDDRGNVALISRGDALSEHDPPVSGDELLGRVTSIVRGRSRMDPQRGLGIPAWLAVWCLRHSEFLARLFLHLHALRRRGAAIRPGEGSAENISGFHDFSEA
jgi:hypothetical protein